MHKHFLFEILFGFEKNLIYYKFQIKQLTDI